MLPSTLSSAVTTAVPGTSLVKRAIRPFSAGVTWPSVVVQLMLAWRPSRLLVLAKFAHRLRPAFAADRGK